MHLQHLMVVLWLCAPDRENCLSHPAVIFIVCPCGLDADPCFCATSCKEKGVALRWFDTAGRPVYVCFMVSRELGGGVHVLHSPHGGHVLHSPQVVGHHILHSLQGVMFSKRCSPKQVMGVHSVSAPLLIFCTLRLAD